MTVAELIKSLKNLPPDRMVVIRGFEGGVEEVTELEEARIALDVNDEWSYGSHELLDPRDRGDDDNITDAIYLRNSL